MVQFIPPEWMRVEIESKIVKMKRNKATSMDVIHNKNVTSGAKPNGGAPIRNVGAGWQEPGVPG